MNDELEKWIDVWEKASKDIFKDDVKPPVVNKQVQVTDYFGNVQAKESHEAVSLNECDTKYWKHIYKLSKNQKDFAPDPLSEAKIEDDPLASEPVGKTRKLPKKKELEDKAAELGNTANPVIPSTRGKDQRKKLRQSGQMVKV